MSQAASAGALRPATETANLLERYLQVRRTSEALCAPLSAEDAAVQSMPDASPAKWHLAHTTWYFETFVLEAACRGFVPFRQEFRYLFNSYYNAVGEQYPRPKRGLLTRPALAEILAYRRHVDAAITDLLAGQSVAPPWLSVLELGINHEQQHQELILMDIKHLLSCNPLYPAYQERALAQLTPVSPLEWLSVRGGETEIGAGEAGFAFDNERPRHRCLQDDFLFASRLVSNAEYLEFIEDGGYRDPRWWLSDGWSTVRGQDWKHPCYWRERDGVWREFTLCGLRKLDPAAPVSHVSYYEADAFASWSNARLPTEVEWEHVAASAAPSGNFLEGGSLHPLPAAPGVDDEPQQLFGDLWEWTRSPYAPYPGYRPPAGAVGEYNGKFMCNQFVLRGGSCATPADHIRASYRNFFYPHTHWHFSGIRLARDLA